MTDDLDDLKRMMDRVTPDPDPDRRAANLRLAQENFARLQGSPSPARPTHRRAFRARVTGGVRKMLDAMTTKAGLAATTAVAALALVWVVQTPGVLVPPGADPTLVTDETAGTGTRSRSDDTDVGGGLPEGIPDRLEESTQDAPIMPAPMEAIEAEALIGGDAGARSGPSAAPPAVPDSFTSELRAGRGVAPGADTLTVAPQAKVAAPEIAAEPPAVLPEADTEAYATADPNPVRLVAEAPVSTFSADVDTASWSVLRSSLMAGALPPRGAVRVEEMINYFPYAYPAPEGPHPFRPTVTVTGNPWRAGSELVHIAIQGRPVTERPPLNLVFLIDTSGSMQDRAKLPLLKQALRLMLPELAPGDEVAMVVYAGSAGRVLDPTPADDRDAILGALDRLEAGGSTAGEEGLRLAYATARGMAAEGEVSRVILATDGDFNVGLSDPTALRDFIAEERADGTYLSVLGFGRGNLDDATMQALAQNGNGQAAYIDTLSEARKVLVDQLSGTLFPIADDVKLQVEFNPARVAEYRLIGYETRALRREDFNNDRVDAGDIGAGHQVTAIYEIARVGSEGLRNDPLRYGAAPARRDGPDELGLLRLRYKAPGAADSVLVETPIADRTRDLAGEAAFATAIAGFGQLLRGSDLLGDWTWADAIALAAASRGEDPFGYRAEAVELMRLAEALSR